MRCQKVLFVFCAAGALSLASGCASLTEAGRKVWGTSIAHLESARSEAHVLVARGSLTTVFDQVKAVLAKAGAQVYLESPDRAYLAAMGFKGHVDTTQAGIFFTSVSAEETKLEVSSLSPRLARQVAEFISQDEGMSVSSEKGEGA